MFSSIGKVTSPNSAPADNVAQEIPEWKKILIMKKRTGAGTDEEIKQSASRSHFRGPFPTSGEPDGFVDSVGRRENSPAGTANKFQMSRSPRCLDVRTENTAETTSDKVVKTIGNIKVQLRPVHKICTPVEYTDEDSTADRLISPLSEPAGASLGGGDWDDNDDDLQYGPGIVDKLRARFLNLEAKSRRKPVVGKFSSLENLTGGGSAFRANGSFQPRIGEKRFGMRTGKSYSNFSQRGGTNFKKAQSMETLLVGSGDSVGSNRRVLNARIFSRTSSSQVKEKSPSPVSKISDAFRFGNKTDFVRQTSAPSINEDELPRPDTVKHFKRIFESPPQSQVEDKMCHSAGAVNHIVNENKTTVTTATCGQSPRSASVLGTPASVGAKETSSAILGNATSDSVTSGFNSESKSIAAKSAKEESSSRSVVINELPVSEEKVSASLINTQRNSAPRSPDVNGDVISTSVNKEKDLFISRTPSTSIKTDDDPRVRAKETNVLKQEESFLESQFSKVTCDRLPRWESSSSDEDVSSDHRLEVPSQAEREKERSVGDNLSVGEEDLQPEEEEVIDTTQNGEVMVVAAESQGEEHLRSSDVARTQLGSARKPSNWQKPPPATTSIVFDFRGKDVKPNISLNPAPFGCRPAKVKKRAGSPPRGDSPKVNGTNFTEKDDSDEDEEDWDEMDVGADLPAISGIVFAGENVKVGKGSLLERRNKNLTIQFDDSATSTYEYPCESPGDENEQSSVDKPKTSNSLQSSTAISSSSGLSSYTPHVLNSGEEFKLGVSRPPVLRYASSIPKKCESPVNAKDELIPATPEDSTGWSSTDSADILF